MTSSSSNSLPELVIEGIGPMVVVSTAFFLAWFASFLFCVLKPSARRFSGRLVIGFVAVQMQLPLITFLIPFWSMNQMIGTARADPWQRSSEIAIISMGALIVSAMTLLAIILTIWASFLPVSQPNHITNHD